jgi:2-keto-4-pentenoate hydratase/2-oxohepta-3-ene-1,7-dioic acid hydratase in catechol pathway
MNRCLLATLLAATMAGALLSAQAPTPFKLGTFQLQNRTFVGVVLRDSVVIDLTAANAAVTPASAVAMPVDMKDLITRYEAGIRDRIGQIVRAVGTASGSQPAYVHELTALKTLPPIMYPTTMLNAAVNYREHGEEMARREARAASGGAAPSAPAAAPQGTALPNTTSVPGIWERRPGDTRWNPYLFVKPSAAVIADREAIRIPPGRTQIDWECELGVVVGRSASRVPVAQAARYIFGYTIQHDVSDRGGRGDTRFNSDWLIGKSHDTFAPLGPFIVPKEFVPDPQKLPVKFTLNGQLMQDANTSFMIHDVFELLTFSSNILTLRPGDVIATGSPAGVGSARTPPIFLKAGDRTSCTYEGVGTLQNPVEAG